MSAPSPPPTAYQPEADDFGEEDLFGETAEEEEADLEDIPAPVPEVWVPKASLIPPRSAPRTPAPPFRARLAPAPAPAPRLCRAVRSIGTRPDLQKAVVWAEILAPPLALRKPPNHEI